MIKAIVENSHQMIITSGLITFVIDYHNTVMFLGTETSRDKLYAKRGELAWRNANDRGFKKSDLRNKAYSLSQKEKAAIVGFCRTENVEISLPQESDDWQAVANFFAGRKKEQGEVLHIINQCKQYAKNLMQELVGGYDDFCEAILDCFSLKEGIGWFDIPFQRGSASESGSVSNLANNLEAEFKTIGINTVATI